MTFTSGWHPGGVGLAVATTTSWWAFAMPSNEVYKVGITADRGLWTTDIPATAGRFVSKTGHGGTKAPF